VDCGALKEGLRVVLKKEGLALILNPETNQIGREYPFFAYCDVKEAKLPFDR
jgi:hypothetical protein